MLDGGEARRWPEVKAEARCNSTNDLLAGGEPSGVHPWRLLVIRVTTLSLV